jgi:hypothetical protein
MDSYVVKQIARVLGFYLRHRRIGLLLLITLGAVLQRKEKL